jgi:hypothetical protein
MAYLGYFVPLAILLVVVWLMLRRFGWPWPWFFNGGDGGSA